MCAPVKIKTLRCSWDSYNINICSRAMAPSDSHTEDDSESESCLGLIPHQVCIMGT